MRFWAREIVGWLLVLLGLGVFFFAFLYLIQHWIVESIPWTIIGVVIFRGGIHLLKIAVAARIALRVQDQLEAAKPAALHGLPSSTRPASRPGVSRR